MKDLPPPPDRRLPTGFGIAIDPGVRFHDGGAILVGGSPVRIVRLSDRGAAVVAGWRRGGRCRSGAELALARRLLDTGLGHPRPEPGYPATDDVTVVVPVRDRAGALARCLAAVGPCRQIVVVDDGSVRGGEVAAVAAEHDACYLRHECNLGPAAARNTGLRHSTTPYVAFVDSDCRPEPGWLPILLPHFQDPAVGAVAPRVRSPVTGTWLTRYDAARSSLDMGTVEAPVLPRSRVPYVPSAALVVRRKAVGDGFDPAFRFGEDVDLVWRLGEAGWTVRYAPAARVRHEPGRHAVAWAARRFRYGTSAAPLARAHPGHVPPVVLSGWSLTAWALAAAGRPGAGVAVVVAAAGALGRRLPIRRGRFPAALRLAGIGTLAAGESLAVAGTRTWWPLAVPAMLSRRGRRRVATAVVARLVTTWVRDRPAMDPLRFAAACLLDDFSYGAGVWWGSLRYRTVTPLLPRLIGRVPAERRPGRH